MKQHKTLGRKPGLLLRNGMACGESHNVLRAVRLDFSGQGTDEPSSPTPEVSWLDDDARWTETPKS